MKTDIRQEWRTPKNLWDLMDACYRFNFDLAANSGNALCEAWVGPDNKAEWLRDIFSPLAGRVFAGEEPRTIRAYCNPGFSGFAQWLPRCRDLIRQFDAFDFIVVMALVDPSTGWWAQWAMDADEIVFLRPRVQFVAPPGVRASSNTKPNCLLIYRPRPVNYYADPRFVNWDWKTAERYNETQALLARP
ncbi:MAG TPA: DNA N-6-adenine-methyltransferase [Candidatus Latescibacteria bacterium]|nr:DNA N-6-adenine-methyltransferase [Candidatus Latescibacterota bacterium]